MQHGCMHACVAHESTATQATSTGRLLNSNSLAKGHNNRAQLQGHTLAHTLARTLAHTRAHTRAHTLAHTLARTLAHTHLHAPGPGSRAAYRGPRRGAARRPGPASAPPPAPPATPAQSQCSLCVGGCGCYSCGGSVQSFLGFWPARKAFRFACEPALQVSQSVNHPVRVICVSQPI